MEAPMALKAITLRLDEEEYEKLKEHLGEFGDPDINVAYVLRAYIRDLNRAFPYILKSGWELKNFFGSLGLWLKQFGAMTDIEMFAKGAFDLTKYWRSAMGLPPEGTADSSAAAEEKEAPRPPKKRRR
jgi:hypothetical protein